MNIGIGDLLFIIFASKPMVREDSNKGRPGLDIGRQYELHVQVSG